LFYGKNLLASAGVPVILWKSVETIPLFLVLPKQGEPETKRRQESMNKYELAVVVNAQIDDEARTAAVENVKSLITRFGGQIGEITEWGKKKLAYEIQKMNEGYYFFIPFEAEGSAIAEIESRMRIMDNVIRYLCVKQDEA
jgi:small subunit ribosomal protein S6